MELNENGLPKLKKPKIRPCPKCGEMPKLRYSAGGVGNILGRNDPLWFILCEKCCNNLAIAYRSGTFEAQQKALTKLGRLWNGQMSAKDIVMQVVLVEAGEEEENDQP